MGRSRGVRRVDHGADSWTLVLDGFAQRGRAIWNIHSNGHLKKPSTKHLHLGDSKGILFFMFLLRLFAHSGWRGQNLYSSGPVVEAGKLLRHVLWSAKMKCWHRRSVDFLEFCFMKSYFYLTSPHKNKQKPDFRQIHQEVSENKAAGDFQWTQSCWVLDGSWESPALTKKPGRSPRIDMKLWQRRVWCCSWEAGRHNSTWSGGNLEWFEWFGYVLLVWFGWFGLFGWFVSSCSYQRVCLFPSKRFKKKSTKSLDMLGRFYFALDLCCSLWVLFGFYLPRWIDMEPWGVSSQPSWKAILYWDRLCLWKARRGISRDHSKWLVFVPSRFPKECLLVGFITITFCT